MKKLIIILATLIILPLSFAHAGTDSNSKSLDTVLKEIRTEQKLSADASIDYKKLSDSQLEEVGEAVMSLMIPDSKQHALMDQMMGGEGSKSLQAMHIMMGQNYLSGNSNYGYGMMGGYGGYGMMGGGMMSRLNLLSSNGYSSLGMMGNYGNFGGGMMGYGYSIWPWISMILFWALIILAITALVRYLYKSNKK